MTNDTQARNAVMLKASFGLDTGDVGRTVRIQTNSGPRTGILQAVRVTKTLDIVAVIVTDAGEYKSGRIGTQSASGNRWDVPVYFMESAGV